MQHTIYFGDKPLTITDVMPDEVNKSTLIAKSIEAEPLQRLIAAMDGPEASGALLVYPDVEVAINALKPLFQFIQAAGGLVQSDKGNLLLIFRKGKWDLPKGKLDPGEDLEQCAVREVEEETGLKDVVLQKPLCRTYHTYYQDGQHCLKESHWYLMQAPQQDDLKPQTEEDIEQAIWAAPAAIPQYLTNTHRSVADVLKMALQML